MKFQTRQPQRLLESGRIVSSLDPRDFDTLSAWFFGQRWIGLTLACAIWAVTFVGLFFFGRLVYRAVDAVAGFLF